MPFLVCAHQLRFMGLRQSEERSEIVNWRLKLPTLALLAIVVAAVLGSATSYGFFW
jgi:hypothetical protein